MIAGAFHAAFERAADQIAGAESDREREGENNASEQNAKGEPDDISAHLKMIEHHRRGHDQHQPLDAEREKPRVMQLRIYGADQDRAREKASDQNTCDEQETPLPPRGLHKEAAKSAAPCRWHTMCRRPIRR